MSMSVPHHLLHRILSFFMHPMILLPWFALLIPGLNMLRTDEAFLVWLAPTLSGSP
jgi:hypothetical protein